MSNNPYGISDEEFAVLEETARARSITIDELLVELGYINPDSLSDEKELTAVFSAPADQTAEEIHTEEAPTVPAAEEIHTEEAPTAPEKETTTLEEIPAEADSIFPEFEESAPLPPAAEEPEEPSTNAEEENEDGEQPPGTTTAGTCPQCGWNLEDTDVIEVTPEDKRAFLHVLLGQKVFVKTMKAFGGNLRLTFRSLTTREIDEIYKEAYEAAKQSRQEGNTPMSAADYYEYVNRLRLCLQLTAVQAAKASLHITLPPGLSKSTHPGASSYWTKFLKQKGMRDRSRSLLDQIDEYVFTHVLSTEQLQRAATHECSRFNRLGARLEMSINNPDFWKATEVPA